MKETLNKHFPINLQMFAEGDGGQSGGNQENTNQGNGGQSQNKYSDDDYLKLKGNFDKTSSELAELKKQLKAKMTDDEKKAEEEKAKATEMEKMRVELATMKVQNKLTTIYSPEETKELSTLIIEGDIDKLVDKLVEFRTAFKTKVYDEAKKEFSQSAKVPGGGGTGEGGQSELIKELLGKEKGKNNARDYYFGNKK